ncbi:nuclear transport factor 2 family protein [Parasphingorhabdus sp. JC815]|uniref:nuclear transport factor 2 family protein n=1 Tax=Parasphingorhabdus sp. JC815 TaxID=3232140 RepID=UPI00345B0892
MSARQNLKAWHARLADKGHENSPDNGAAELSAQLAEDAVFHSPVVHTPQVGKLIVMAYLTAADTVLGNDSFRYVREIVDDDANMAMLEFTLELDDIQVNGVDIITWNDEGLIQDFKVMVRPLKAINKVWEEMGKMLEKMKN